MASDGRQASPETGAAHASRIYALVAYVPGVLGAYLDELKWQLHPWGPRGRSHVTVLQPRPLNGSAPGVLVDLRERAGRSQSFQVETAGVSVFPGTNVLYIEVADGAPTLRRLHRTLNAGLSSFVEPYPFHPHITLAVAVPDDQVSVLRRRAEELWADYAGPRAFHLRSLAFVQNLEGDRWADIGSLHLGDGNDGDLAAPSTYAQSASE